MCMEHQFYMWLECACQLVHVMLSDSLLWSKRQGKQLKLHWSGIVNCHFAVFINTCNSLSGIGFRTPKGQNPPIVLLTLS